MQAAINTHDRVHQASRIGGATLMVVAINTHAGGHQVCPGARSTLMTAEQKAAKAGIDGTGKERRRRAPAPKSIRPGDLRHRAVCSLSYNTLPVLETVRCMGVV
jgi:hypothetical protein